MGGLAEDGEVRQHSAERRSDDGGSRVRDDERRKANDELPQPFDARALAPAKKRARSKSPGRDGDRQQQDQQRKLKRPGQRARISNAEHAAIRQRALERERQIALEESERQQQQQQQVPPFPYPYQQQQQQQQLQHQRGHIDDVVRSHYNAVPERGREWRKTASTIKGLRSLNNWVKSCIIQKFSPDEDFYGSGGGGGGRKDLLVLDIGCGKGGDLGKWQQAPQKVQLYVGLDPADVSIQQARGRYHEMTQRGGGRRGGRGGGRGGYGPRIFSAHFIVKDCYSESIGDVEVVREVGFDANPLSHSGFDVVSMMFCMHYAFESEQQARTMLKNVSSALKKGGRFIGCIPDSDVIGERVRQFHARKEERERRAAEQAESDGRAAEERETEKETEAGPDKADADKADKAVPEPAEAGKLNENESETAEWGNSIYRIRFPGPTPADGVFRPPFGWKYSFFLNEAVEEVPEYVVPWHAFRALAEDYNLELQYHKPFRDIWDAEKDDRTLGPLSERMSVRDRHTGQLLVSDEEMEAAGLYVGFCFYKV